MISSVYLLAQVVHQISAPHELMVEITDPTELPKLCTVAQQMVNRAVPAQEYSLNKTLEREE